MTKMVALKEFEYAKRMLAAGEVFETEDPQHDFVMETSGLCRKSKHEAAEEPKQEAVERDLEQPKSKPNQPPKGDRYLRRDLRAKE